MSQTSPQLDLFDTISADLGAGALTVIAFELIVSDCILEILRSAQQPTASELLSALEKKYGWRVRQSLIGVVQSLRDDKEVEGYLRDYLRSTLTDDELTSALRGGVKPSKEFASTVDDLFRKSVTYRNSAEFRKAVEFSAKFRDYAPFNNMLVKVQNPSCGFYATAKDWRERFERTIKEDARPMLILAPMHPVMLVFDLDSTDGKPLPDKFENFAQADGEWNPNILGRTAQNAQRDGILIQRKKLSSTHGGFATTEVRDAEWKRRIVTHAELDDKSAYAILCHELAHIYLGHLGGDEDGWWPSRINLTHATVEIEAEAVAYIVCLRAGLKASSEAYLSSYLTTTAVPESVSLELIAKVAGKLEEMGRGKLPPRKTKE